LYQASIGKSVPNIHSVHIEYSTKTPVITGSWFKVAHSNRYSLSLLAPPISQSLLTFPEFLPINDFKIDPSKHTTVIRYYRCNSVSKRICSTSCSVQTPCFKLKYTQAQYSGQIKEVVVI